MTLYLVRHPATAWTGVRYLGRRDLGWSRAGHRRAEELVAGFRGRLGPSALVITSPLRRARALADRLAAATGCSVEIDRRWMEVDVGRVEGRTFGELEALDPRLAGRLSAGDLRVDWPAGERFADLEARVVEALGDARLRPVRPIVVITHAGPIAVLLDRLRPTGTTLRFVGAGDALALDEGDAGTWSVRPLGIPTR
ncbi:MAG TPA: histidine phosphatase family protein [Candidatus Limnocylindrales bacterium]|jgi:probable phosphoglycerate mutase|nr:histidine phosphatase family protein [Candidatus Limnocylindrales bacterium]